jgi:predicted phosphodiesterase
MNRILVVGDCHIDDDQDHSRFDLLGKLIIDEMPTHIILMGDFLTLNCLSAWDMDKRKTMEGRRYKTEIDAGLDALQRMLTPIDFYNVTRREQKKAQYKPEMVFLEGNHEERLTRYLDSDPTFDGFVSVRNDLKLDGWGFRYIPYRDWYYLNGIGFTHIPHNELKPVTGRYHIHASARATVDSCVYGHTHKLEVLCQHLPGMSHLQQLTCAGCFFEKHDAYVHGRVTHYWKGVLLLENYKPGRYDIITYSLGRLRRKYGSMHASGEGC